MEWNIEGKDIIGWIISVVGIIITILLPYFKKFEKPKKSCSKNTHREELKKRQESTKSTKRASWVTKIWDTEKEFLPQRLFFIFLILAFSIFLKFGFDYLFLTSLNLSLTGLLICLLSWAFFSILKLWRKMSETHPYFFSKEHKTYCSKENKNCYCRVWKRRIVFLSFCSIITFLLIYFLLKFFLFLI